MVDRIGGKNGVPYPYSAAQNTARDAKEARSAARAPALLRAEVRAKRNELLRESDKTQVEDSPFPKPAWRAYRQALRDITSHTNFPDLLPGDWPVAP